MDHPRFCFLTSKKMENNDQSRNNNSNTVKQRQEDASFASIDCGHRLGNFHNYYAFHPIQSRINPLKQGILDHIAKSFIERNSKDATAFELLDIGCNEGDLTIELACQLSAIIKHSTTSLRILGLDIDPELVQRANQKYSDFLGGDNNILAAFEVCNVCNLETLRTTCSLNSTQGCFDLITLFSTTMWIHIHSGDDGLRHFLRSICDLTHMLLIEPQPSRCYRNVNVRLRKMDRPQVNISNLQMRANIEQEIELFITKKCGFRRSAIGSSFQSSSSWNRYLQLYERDTDS